MSLSILLYMNSWRFMHIQITTPIKHWKLVSRLQKRLGIWSFKFHDCSRLDIVRPHAAARKISYCGKEKAWGRKTPCLKAFYLQPFFEQVIFSVVLTQWLDWIWVLTPHPVLPPLFPMCTSPVGVCLTAIVYNLMLFCENTAKFCIAITVFHKAPFFCQFFN